jgi:hypothetical protein
MATLSPCWSECSGAWSGSSLLLTASRCPLIPLKWGCAWQDSRMVETFMLAMRKWFPPGHVFHHSMHACLPAFKHLSTLPLWVQGASKGAVEAAVLYHSSGASVDILIQGHCGPGAAHAVTVALPENTLMDTSGDAVSIGKYLKLPCHRQGIQHGSVPRHVLIFASVLFVVALVAGAVAVVAAACGAHGGRAPRQTATALAAATVSLFLLGEFPPTLPRSNNAVACGWWCACCSFEPPVLVGHLS